uniref:Uncharacterized protein n=1 Tax=Strongyloides venezuelensis TaxID=75913 RepID=A0A0K0EUI4_STRVS
MSLHKRGHPKSGFNYNPEQNKNESGIKRVINAKGQENDERSKGKKFSKTVVLANKIGDLRKVNESSNFIKIKSSSCNMNMKYGSLNNLQISKGRVITIHDSDKNKEKKEKNQENKNFMIDYGVLEGPEAEFNVSPIKEDDSNCKNEETAVNERHTVEQYDKRKNFCEKLLSIKSLKSLLICPAFKDAKYKPSDYTKKAWSENPNLNRYDDVFCIDSTRVHLRRHLLESTKTVANLSGNPNNNRSDIVGRRKNDYIHGNYVRIPNSDYVYICTQGPLPHTIEDFLLMCWQEDSKVIIMLCELEEDNSEKCSKYWPDVKSTMTFGKIRVYNEREDARKYEGITIRTLKIYLGDSTKVMIQYHLKTWPDHLVPPSSSIIVTLLREAQLISSRNPIVVHCSAGIGRTGTFIGIHYASERFKNQSSGEIILLDVIREIRTQRLHSVQSTIQFAYLNICLLEYFALDNIIEYDGNVKQFISKNIAYIQEYAKRLLLKKNKINLK